LNQTEMRKLWKLMGSFFPKMIECSPQQLEENIKNWAIVMGDIDHAEAEMAVMLLVRSHTYDRLKVADIVKSVKDMRNASIPTAEEAWKEVLRNLNPYRRPEWSCSLIQDAVRTMGFLQLCNSENPSIDRAQFLKIYNNLRDRQQDRQENNVVLQLVGGRVKLIG
jgi:hypothetical protein